MLKCIGVSLHLHDALSLGLFCGVIGCVLALDLIGASRRRVSLYLLNLSDTVGPGASVSAVIGDRVSAAECRDYQKSNHRPSRQLAPA